MLCLPPAVAFMPRPSMTSYYFSISTGNFPPDYIPQLRECPPLWLVGACGGWACSRYVFLPPLFLYDLALSPLKVLILS